MALKMLVARKDNHLRAEFPAAYFQVFEVNVNKRDNTVRMNVRVFADKEARNFKEEDSPVLPAGIHSPGMHTSTLREESESCACDLFEEVEGGNLFEKAYNYLKTCCGKYSAAEDC